MAPISSYTEKQVKDLIKTSESGMPYPDSTTQSTRNLTVDQTGQLHFIKDKFYAYSGSFPASTTTTTRLEFTTNSQTLEGTWHFTGNVALAAPNNDEGATCMLYFNDVLIAHQKFYQGEPNSLSSVPVIIPPFTRVTIQSDANDNQADRVATTSIIGNVL